jgi:Fe-S cluster biogenesis protein NfuA
MISYVGIQMQVGCRGCPKSKETKSKRGVTTLRIYKADAIADQVEAAN